MGPGAAGDVVRALRARCAGERWSDEKQRSTGSGPASARSSPSRYRQPRPHASPQPRLVPANSTGPAQELSLHPVAAGVSRPHLQTAVAVSPIVKRTIWPPPHQTLPMKSPMTHQPFTRELLPSPKHKTLDSRRRAGKPSRRAPIAGGLLCGLMLSPGLWAAAWPDPPAAAAGDPVATAPVALPQSAHETMDPIRIYADFNLRFEGRIPLDCRGSLNDLAKAPGPLADGVPVLLYGEGVEVMATLRYSNEHRVWMADPDWETVRRPR